MATIKVGIDVSDNGTAQKATKAAERLKQAYDAAGNSAKNIGAGGGTGGKTMAGAQARAASSAELVEYNRQRAVAVGTGASARDFAKQSEGLGGLVRLYATFAANVFAVTAAFSALSRAMDTTNMIKGLDQLGAASGQSLVSLSKKLVETTGGAVSLREAMEATAKASTSGINSENILRLGKVAQQASATLGVNAVDALSRLSRGIVKLEPELLDELGIFTKLDPAVKEYAKSVNKSVSELTDFERRQAFTNAVLAEGEKKFSQIQIDTNPYTKLSAALQDTLQSALEFLNKGLVPIVNYLSQSPATLTAGLVAIGTVLLKQALPAIGQVRAGLAQAAEDARSAASGKAGEALAARNQLKELLVKQVEEATDEQIKKVDNAEKKLLEIKGGSISKQSAIYKLLQKDIVDVEQADIDAAKAQAGRISTNSKARAAEKAALNDVISSVESWKSANQQETVVRTKQLENTLVYKKVIKDAADFELKAKRDAIVSNAAYNASLLGVKSSWTLFKLEIASSGLAMGKFATATLYARAALATLAGAATTLVNVLGKIFFVLGIVTTAWSLLSGLFSNKAVDDFNSSLQTLETSTENLSKTFQQAEKNNPFSEDSLKAKSSALLEFSSNLSSLSTNADRALGSLSASTFANLKDKFFGLFGGGVLDEFQENFAATVSLAFSEISDPTILSKLKKDVAYILELGIAEPTAEAVKTALESLDIKPSSREVADIAKAFKQAGIEAGNVASRIREVKNAVDDTLKASNDLKDTYKIKNPIIEFAEKGATSLEKLNNAIKNSANAQQFEEAIKAVSENLDTIPFFGSGTDSDKFKRNFKDFQTRFQEILRTGAVMPLEDMKKTASAIMGAEAGDNITKGLAYFNDIIRKQLEIEKTKNQNALKEYSLSLLPELNDKALALQVQEAKASLDAVRQEFELAKTLSGNKPLTQAQTAGFESRIAQLNNTVLITQFKQQLELAKKNSTERLKDLEVEEAILKANKDQTENRFLAGKLTEKEYINEQKILSIREAQLKGEQEQSRLNLQNDIDLKVLEILKNTKAITVAEYGSLKAGIVNLYNQKTAARIQQGRLGFIRAELDAKLRLNSLEYESVSLLSRKRDLEKELISQDLQKQVSLQEYILDLSVQLNNSDSERLLSLESIVDALRNSTAYTQQINSLTTDYINTQAFLVKETVDAEARGDAERVRSLQEQIALNSELFAVRLGEEESKKARADVLAQLRLDRKRVDIQNQLYTIVQETYAITRESGVQAQNAEISLLEERLGQLKEISAVTESEYLARKSILDIQKLELDISDRRYRAIIDTAGKIRSLQTQIETPGTSTEIQTALRSQQDALRTQLVGTLELLSVEENQRRTNLGIVAELAIKDAKRTENIRELVREYSKLNDISKTIGDNIGGYIGKFADVVGKLTEVLQEDVNSREEIETNYNKKRLQIAEKYKDDEREKSKQLFDLRVSELLELDTLELKTLAKSSKATKTFFKEKTFAYKALTAIEKAAAAQTLIFNLQTVASTLATLPAKVAGGVAQLVSLAGPVGLVAAGGFLALMASLGFGGGKSVPRISAEESRKTQTTGQYYSGTTLVTRAGAIQADPTATLKSIDESLEVIKNSGFDDLNIFNKMSKSLEKIDLNTRALAESLAISLGKTFSRFQGNVTSVNPVANALSSPVLKAGGAVGGGLLGFTGGSVLAGAAAGPLGALLGQVLTGSATGSILGGLGMVGGPIGMALGALLGANLDKIITSIFGGKKATTVRDFGITVEGTIDKIAQASTNLIKGFAELDVKVSGGWFSRNKYFVESLVVDLDQQVNRPIFEYIGTLFTGIKDSLVNSAEVLGTNIDSIIETAVIEPIKVSTKDAKPEEIAERIKNQTSAVFNEIAIKAFGPLIEALRNPLEEAGTTLTRIATQSQVFSQSMLLLSKNVENITGTLKAVIADDLVKAFGGLEEYENKVQFFRENFLTEAEQIAPVSQKLTEAFQELKISSSLTRDQYKALVLQQDLTTTSGRETFTALLNLSEAFDKVTDFAEKAKEKLDGFATTIRNFIKEQTLQIAGSQQGLTYLLKEFQTTVQKSLQGDEKSLSYLTDIAGRTIESARSSSRTTREFNLLRAGVVSSLAEVATQIESGNLELLTPQEQANVILEQIENNTAKLPEDLAQTLAKQIDTVLNPATATAITTTVAGSAAANDSVFVTGGDGPNEGGPTQSGPITSGQLALANAVVGATQTLSDTIKGNPVLGLLPGAGLIVLTNAAANDVINQAVSQHMADMFESGAAGGGISVSASDLSDTSGIEGWKNGGAFLKGVQMFESGGAFSNSVVSNPTLFPMGVMGEAGPEAIMPLTRTADGSLGVTADIPFNNNNQANEQLIREVRELKKEMEKVRMGVEVTATGTNKTFRLLDRVTEAGDAFNVLAVEGSVTTLASVQGGSF